MHVMPGGVCGDDVEARSSPTTRSSSPTTAWAGFTRRGSWWALDYYGHSNCKVLNGGFRKWFEEGRAVSLDQPHVERGRFEVRAVREEICATTDQLKLAIGDGDKVIWDVRAPAEYTGDDQRANKHGGHIPGAANLEWLDLTVQPPVRSGLLLPAEEIARKLAAIGVTPDKQVYTHCQAGIRAAQAVFVLRLMGYPRAANYDGSWSEWGNRDDTPIVAALASGALIHDARNAVMKVAVAAKKHSLNNHRYLWEAYADVSAKQDCDVGRLWSWFS